MSRRSVKWTPKENSSPRRDPVFAYDVDYPEVAVSTFGEWERLPPGGVMLPVGVHAAEFVLT